MQRQRETLFEKFSNWWDEMGWELPNCPISRGNNWILAEEPVEFQPYLGGAKATPGAIYPAFMIVCQDCGYTMFINAGITGLI